jgi:hypothetical protein
MRTERIVLAEGQLLGVQVSKKEWLMMTERIVLDEG